MASEYGKMQDVDPISADMLQTVAIAVAPSVEVPGPKNSRMVPLPPETVRRPARWRIMSGRFLVREMLYRDGKIALGRTFRACPAT
jgi:hypothetical protein